jgi:urea carboxylase-associated protein 1
MPAITESLRDPSLGVFSCTIPAGEHWEGVIKKGQTFRIVDLEGNQAADTLFYDAADPLNRYSADVTIRTQAGLYLTTGTSLMSTRGDRLLVITADTCGRHDTLGGACSRESNVMRYAFDKEGMHACRDSFIAGALELGLSKRDITCNINFFMNVPVTPDGKLTFEDGISAPGRYVEMVAEREVICLISNCPQLNNPCNGYDPTPVRVVIWD